MADVHRSVIFSSYKQWKEEKRKAKEKKRYSHLNAEFQRIARRDKKAFLRDQCKEIKENNRMGKTRDLFKNFPEFVVIHTVKGFAIVNKVEVDVFLELSCFFDDPRDVGKLISGCSAFSTTSLNIWKFTVHVLLKPGLENFECYFAGMWDECSWAVVWKFFGIGMKSDFFQSCGHCWVFQICWHIECSTLTALPFRIW